MSNDGAPPITRRTPAEVRAYIDGFEEGALRALGHVADQRPDLEDVTMTAAERIGSMITAMQATVDAAPIGLHLRRGSTQKGPPEAGPNVGSG